MVYSLVERDKMWVYIREKRSARVEVKPNGTGSHEGFNPDTVAVPVECLCYPWNQSTFNALALYRRYENLHFEFNLLRRALGTIKLGPPLHRLMLFAFAPRYSPQSALSTLALLIN